MKLKSESDAYFTVSIISFDVVLQTLLMLILSGIQRWYAMIDIGFCLSEYNPLSF